MKMKRCLSLLLVLSLLCLSLTGCGNGRQPGPGPMPGGDDRPGPVPGGNDRPGPGGNGGTVVLGDSFRDQGKLSQARATWESIRDGYTPSSEGDDILESVNQRIASL